MTIGSRRSAGLLALLAALACAACENEGPTGPVQLVVSLDSISITGGGSASFDLSTAPRGELDWQLTAKPTWVEVDQSSGTIRGSVRIHVTASGLAALEPGTYTGHIQIISSSGAVLIRVVGVVPARPVPTPSPSSLSMADSVEQTSFELKNTGNSTLEWSIAPSADWISTSPASGELAVGDSTTVTVTVDRRGVPAGSHAEKLRIESNSPDGVVEVPLTVAVPVFAQAETEPEGLELATPTDSTTLTLRNVGNAPLTWSISASQAWVTVTPASGETAAGASQTIVVRVDRDTLDYGRYDGQLTVESNSRTGTLLLPVTIIERPAAPSGLDHRVVDAEYDRVNDVIVTVSANPSRLNVIDPATGSVRSVALALSPTSVSVGPSGTHAAVGHDGYVTYVSLATPSVVSTRPVPIDVLDVVLAGNGYAYAFPRRDQWTNIYSLNLATGTVTESTASIYAGTVARLHPSGDYMYGAQNGISPSDFEKYDIRSGTAQVLYNSPYHGDYAMGGNVWISDDGTRLFAKSRNVFRSSTAQSEDMVYSGKFEGIEGVRWAEHSTAAGRIFVVPQGGWDAPNTTVVEVYGPQYLEAKGEVPLPRFPGAGTSTWDAYGRFAFVNAAGTRYYVLVQADPNSGMALDWGIVTAEVAKTP